jgi:trans-aconitate 2-methyltransferase
MTDWDATRYHRISGPQFDWGQRVIARLQPAPGERILDLGCGTGRVTREILGSMGAGMIVGLDQSGAMLAVARASEDPDSPAGRVAYVRGTGTALPFHAAFDAVFSAATLHWIPDHSRVFATVFDALVDGGRFVAQCGGDGNLARLVEHASPIMRSPLFSPYFRDWSDPWYFADPDVTAARLVAAGFIDERAWLEEAPVPLGSAEAYAEFVSVVCIRHQLERLPLDLRPRFVEELTERASKDSRPFVLDYWRLNIAARKAGT